MTDEVDDLIFFLFFFYRVDLFFIEDVQDVLFDRSIGTTALETPFVHDRLNFDDKKDIAVLVVRSSRSCFVVYGGVIGNSVGKL